MRTFTLENRRYKRLARSLPGTLTGCGRDRTVAARSLNISTGGAAFVLPGAPGDCAVGDLVEVEIALSTPGNTFATPGTVRHVTGLSTPDGTPEGRRIGIQFREALLLSDLPR